jgi:micrococcal nuclease
MQPDYTYKARIENVVDGDTVDAVVDVGFKMTAKLRLRLLGVNTPELKSSVPEERVKANQAKDYTTASLHGKDVIIKTQKSDAFGRYLATIYYQVGDMVSYQVEWREFNSSLISKGFAVPFKG